MILESRRSQINISGLNLPEYLILGFWRVLHGQFCWDLKVVTKHVLTEQGFETNQTPHEVIKVNDEILVSKTSHNHLM